MKHRTTPFGGWQRRRGIDASTHWRWLSSSLNHDQSIGLLFVSSRLQQRFLLSLRIHQLSNKKLLAIHSSSLSRAMFARQHVEWSKINLTPRRLRAVLINHLRDLIYCKFSVYSETVVELLFFGVKFKARSGSLGSGRAGFSGIRWFMAAIKILIKTWEIASKSCPTPSEACKD